MSLRVYLATNRTALCALRDEGAIPGDAYVAVAAASADEQDEFDAMVDAAGIAAERWGDVLVVAVEADGLAQGAAVGRADVASVHVGEELAWYATQELEDLLDAG